VLGAARFMFSMKPASRHDSSHDLRHIVDIKHVTVRIAPRISLSLWLVPSHAVFNFTLCGVQGAPGSIVLTMANQRKYRFESQLAAEIFTKFQEHLRGMGLQPTCSVVDSDTGEAFANASGRTGPGTKVYELALEKECRTQTSVELRARSVAPAACPPIPSASLSFPVSSSSPRSSSLWHVRTRAMGHACPRNASLPMPSVSLLHDRVACCAFLGLMSRVCGQRRMVSGV